MRSSTFALAGALTVIAMSPAAASQACKMTNAGRVICLPALPGLALARARHHRATHVARRARKVALARSLGLLTVDTAAGPVTVAPAMADRIRGFIRDVVARGFKGRVNCFDPWGHIRGSLHHVGLACDFAQRGWNKTVAVMYRVRDLTTKWGLRNGCSFHHPRRDCGHIDFPNAAGTLSARNRIGHHGGTR